MTERIYITCNIFYQPACELVIEEFKERFNYFDDIELIYCFNEAYGLYEEDIKTINSGQFPYALLIDTRDLDEHKGEPNRLLLTDIFLGQEDEKIDEILLHEIGHFKTNPELIEIRQYISKKNVLFLTEEVAKIQKYFNLFNTGLINIFQIPKLPCEVNGDLWMYKKESEISIKRLKSYCNGLKDSISDLEKAKGDKDFFFQIPRLNYLILFRLSVLRHIKSDYKEECICDTKKAKELLGGLAEQSGFKKLKILSYQDKILDSIEYKKENYGKLISLFEDIFEEYIKKGGEFFPSPDDIVNFYFK